MSSSDDDAGTRAKSLMTKKSSLRMSSPKSHNRSFSSPRRSDAAQHNTGFSTDEDSEEDVLDLMQVNDPNELDTGSFRITKTQSPKAGSQSPVKKRRDHQAEDSDGSVDSEELGDGEKMGGRGKGKNTGWHGNNPEPEPEAEKPSPKSSRRTRSPKKRGGASASPTRRRALVDSDDSDDGASTPAVKPAGRRETASARRASPRRTVKDSSSDEEQITRKSPRRGARTNTPATSTSPSKSKTRRGTSTARGSRSRGLADSDDDSDDDTLASRRSRSRTTDRRFDGRRREGRARAVRVDLRQTTDGTNTPAKATRSSKSPSRAEAESRHQAAESANESDNDEQGNSGRASGGAKKEETKQTESPAASAGESEEELETADLGETLNLTASDMAKFLTSPTPRKSGYGAVQCYIERKKTGMGGANSEYYLFLKHDRRFLLAAKKKAGNKTSNYSVSRTKDRVSDKGAGYLGKVRSNFVGTEFMVYDAGENPEKFHGDEEQIRKELAAITYASNVLGSRGPRKMRVCVPIVDDKSGNPLVFRPTDKSEGLLTRAKEGDSRCYFLINKPPRWNETVRAYVLNFNGRVTQASVKNFQLVHPDDHERVVLQFGRVGTHKFTMDYQYPLSPFQAFAICLSSFDYKLACE